MLSAFLAIAIIAITACVFGTPDSITYLATPLAERGQSPAQLIQSIGLGFIAFFTLLLTYRRTEAMNRQSQAALEQINLNKNQLESAQEKEAREEYRHALDMITETGGGELKTIAGMQLLEEIVRSDPDRYYTDAELLLLSIIRKATHQEYKAITTKISDNEGVIDLDKPWQATEQASLEVKQALDCYSNLRKFNAPEDRKKSGLIGVVISGLNFNGEDFRDLEVHAVLEDCQFKSCKMTGIDFGNCTFRNCTFIGCDLTDASFLGASFGGCRIQDCIVDNATFNLNGDWIFTQNRHLTDHAPTIHSPVKFRYKKEYDAAVAACDANLENAMKADPADPKIAGLKEELEQTKTALFALCEVDGHQKSS